MSLLVLGTVALDDVKTPVGVKKAMLGGSAAHFAMGARLFTDVHLVAVVGKDFPKKHLEFLRRKGINLSSLAQGEGKTFRWKGEYKKEDLNAALTLATELGVLAGFTPQVAPKAKHIANIFLANIDPDMQQGLLKMMARPQFVGLDSMNLWITHKRSSLLKLMKQVNLFVANDGEARALTGETNLIKAAKALRCFGPQMVVVKKGEHGALFYCDKFMFCFPAYPVDKVVDPTGAGDTFAGGLMGYLSRAKKIDENTLKRAVMVATAISSFNVEGFGMTKTAALTPEAVQRRVRELKRFVAPA